MIQNISCLFQSSVRCAGVSQRSSRLSLAGQLPCKAVRYAALYPAGNTRRATIVNPEVGNPSFGASVLERAAHVVGNPKDSHIQVGQMFGVQSQQLIAQAFGNRHIAGPQGFGVQTENRDLFRKQVDVTPSERDDLAKAHGRIESTNKNAAQLRVGRGEQADLLIPAKSSSARNLVSHRHQTFSIIKRRTSQPAHLNGLAQHSSQQCHFAIDARDLSLTSGFFALALSGRFQSDSLEVLKIVKSNSFKASVSEENIERVDIVERVLERAHSSNLPAIHVGSRYQIALTEQVGQVFEGSVSRGASGDVVELFKQSFFGSIPGVGFISTRTPDRVPLTVRPGVGCPAVETGLAADLSFDDRKGSLAHFAYRLIVTFREGSGPHDGTDCPNKQQNGREKVFYFREGQQGGQTGSGLWFRRSRVRIPLAAHLFPSHLHLKLHTESVLPLYSRRCA